MLLLIGPSQRHKRQRREQRDGPGGRESGSRLAAADEMAAANPKTVLSASRDIPFNKLILLQANVRRMKDGVPIDELAEDIARRTLLQSLSEPL
jgi:hypothetical protein